MYERREVSGNFGGQQSFGSGYELVNQLIGPLTPINCLGCQIAYDVPPLAEVALLLVTPA